MGVMSLLLKVYLLFIINNIFTTCGNPCGDPNKEKEHEEVMKKSFETCETDGKLGLTWAEVEPCEKEHGKSLLDAGMSIPTKADFDDADTDGNGVLTNEEWHAKMKKSG